MLLPHEQREKNDDRNWNAEQPEQNAATHDRLLSKNENLKVKQPLGAERLLGSGSPGHLVGGRICQPGERLVRHGFLVERLVE